MVAVRVGEGRRVAVSVGVALGSVLGAVVEVAVDVGGTGEFVAVGGDGGAMTVNVPEDRLRDTELPL